jgi:hypothetical protein
MANAIYEVGQPTDRGTTGSWGAASVDAASAVAEWFPDKEKSIAVGGIDTESLAGFGPPAMMANDNDLIRSPPIGFCVFCRPVQINRKFFKAQPSPAKENQRKKLGFPWIRFACRN